MSPLTRNLRTGYEACYDIFHGLNPPEIYITELAREHAYSICDLGTPPQQLKAAWPQWEHELSTIPDDWWLHKPDGREGNSEHAIHSDCFREPWQHLQWRVRELTSLLHRHLEIGSHTNILLVGHAVLFYAMTGRWHGNCELVELDLDGLRPACECSGYVCRCACEWAFVFVCNNNLTTYVVWTLLYLPTIVSNHRVASV